MPPTTTQHSRMEVDSEQTPFSTCSTIPSDMVNIRLLPEAEQQEAVRHSRTQNTVQQMHMLHTEVFAKSYRQERLKTLIAFLAGAFSGFLNFFILTVIHDVVPRTPLPDLAFMLMPQQPWAIFASDLVIAFLIGFCLILALLHRYRWILFRRFFLIGAFLYGLRAAVLAVTFIPPSFSDPSSYCIPATNKTELGTIMRRFAEYIVTFGLTSTEGKILCGDLMFSGHTLSTTLMYFVILRYTPPSVWLLRWLVTPVCYFGLITIIISGGHYTMDVLIAYWLTSHLFWSYHQIFECPKSQQHAAPLTSLWWYWVAYWFECGVPDGPVPNEYDWPLPAPHGCVDLIERLNSWLNRSDFLPAPCFP